MKIASILTLAGIAAAVEYADFEIPYLRTYMPNGYKFSVWTVEFNVTSQSGPSPATSWCFS